MQKPLKWYDAITTNVYFFALSTRSNIMTPLLLPLLIQQFMGEETKGTAYGNLRLYSLMIALLVQALSGMLSDLSTHKWGKRRPFILSSSILEIIGFVGVGVIAGTMSGEAGYYTLFAVTLLSMVTSNWGHGPAQGLIPDLVPPSKRGMYSGIKALFEVPLPLIFVSFVASKMITAGNYWGAILTLIAVYVVSTGLTMLVKETPQKEAPHPMDWGAIGRLGVMTLAFTAVILVLGFGVRQVVPVLAANLTPAKTLLIGLIGVAAMVIAVGIGVIVSLNISLGSEAKKSPSFTWWVINRLAFLVGASNLASFVLYFVQERFPELSGNAAAKPASTLMMIVGVALLVSSLPAGWLSDKFGTKKLMVAAGLLAAIGTLVVIFSPSTSIMYGGGFLVGLGIGIFYSANWAMGTTLIPKDQAGRYLGLSNLAGAGSGAIGAYIGGPIGDSVGYVLLMGIYGLLFFFSILALTRIKEPGKVEADAIAS